MNKSNWEPKFKEEFGIHFSKSELQFAIAFIEEVEEKAKKEGREEAIGSMLEKITLLAEQLYNAESDAGRVYTWRETIESFQVKLSQLNNKDNEYN